MREPSGNNEHLHGLYFQDISVGMSAQYSRKLSETDIEAFANLSGDTNPLHLDEDYAKTTMFKGRIAHGLLSASYISTVIGTKLPGPGCIYISQSLRFKAPVRMGDEVTAKATVIELNPEKRFVTLKTSCAVDGFDVLTGNATVLVDSRP